MQWFAVKPGKCGKLLQVYDYIEEISKIAAILCQTAGCNKELLINPFAEPTEDFFDNLVQEFSIEYSEKLAIRMAGWHALYARRTA
jgi:hypothetical protein